ncbi:hypothetical protein ACFVQ4_24900 [Streptomyces laurentii]|uniref:hypothetical protein n=1 Tax=Streptomyces laurentii TaxID=39478 RepID=UPI0036B00E33
MSILDEITAAMTELREAEATVEAKRAAAHAAIAAAEQDKTVKQVDIMRVTGYSRETIRKITRAAEAAK